MPITTIPWGDGSGDNIYLSAPSQTGDQSVSVTSDPNTGAARSKVVTFSAVGVSPVSLTINQEAGGGGGDLSDYVQSGLVLHMDGKSGKTGNTSWASVVGDIVFTNNGATFNDDHIAFDGDDDYLTNTDFTTPLNSAGTIEICFERDGTGTRVAYMPKTQNALAFGSVSGVLNWSNGTNRTTYDTLPTKGVASVNRLRAFENGIAMTAHGNTYMSGRSTTTTHIGRRSSGSYFMGKIYSIRIYNRLLTEEEILKNQAVDNIRFNLGLTL